MLPGVTGVVTDAVDVILRDGGTIRLEPPTAADADDLVGFFAGLSERSLYLRFHGYRAVDRSLVEPLLDPDWVTRGALLGRLEDAGESRIVALANYVAIDGSDAAEMAFAVADSE